ncbi:hypothetical protein PC129_g23061 [Phytophthora cactorum]|uniref:Uncharacterized protein n=1 Tax=Phytophthora cactorum TaxID=29920 RepID=A0A8T1GW09_9STRA|nr:hypothetical protein Pcac1_g6687 [Phytophthora cactorum]KAG2792957.1 hypothetical protein PC111_g23238 [Phytophthora cactorum]KAG2793165.1 hypothetical protein PC112_g23563 [Phytophthora cactorum]KAG2813934.1 hypothetical protein PC113_g23378 [Phytophthora cactorum]KAG2877101.1 hypothetical protein PC114_g23835 [Phytophthora cactorum]
MTKLGWRWAEGGPPRVKALRSWLIALPVEFSSADDADERNNGIESARDDTKLPLSLPADELQRAS